MPEKTKISERSDRPMISNANLACASHEVMAKVNQALLVKGRGGWQSSHEILGIVTEEYHELVEAVRSNQIEDVHKELQDLAAACSIGIACINQKIIDW